MPKTAKYMFKIITVGDGMVGKTSLILRFTENTFKETYKKTIGADFAIKNVDIDGTIAKLQIWDLGGQDTFKDLRKIFYPGARGAIYVFDVSNRPSFENIRHWFKDIDAVVGDVPRLLVGNKIDLEREISYKEGKQLADELGMDYLETSAKTGEKVVDIFKIMARVTVGEKAEGIPSEVPAQIPAKVPGISVDTSFAIGPEAELESDIPATPADLLPAEPAILPEVVMDVYEWIESHRNDFIDLLKRLVSADTTNPPGHEFRAARIILEELLKDNIRFRVYESEKDRTNVVSWSGKAENPSVMLVCHHDVAPQVEGWKHPPLDALEKENRIYGLGACCSKGPLVSAIMALRAIHVLNVELNGQAMVVAASDGLGDGTIGLRHLIEEVGLAPNHAIVASPTNCTTIKTVELETLAFRLTSRGRVFEPSFKDINAAEKLVKVLAGFNDSDQSEYPMLAKCSINIREIRGMPGVGGIPEWAEATIDIRHLFKENNEKILDEVRKLIDNVRILDSDVDVTIEELPEPLKIASSVDAPVVMAVRDGLYNTINKEPSFTETKENILAKILVQSKIPVCIFGPGNEEKCNSPNEYIEIDDMIEGAKVFAASLITLLGIKD
ncbi:MAG: M20/M25/M40 family metallo-hydrolase [Candidatus Hodarchaeota archaeon]